LVLEPGNDVGVDAQRQLFLYRPIEKAALGIGPVANLGNIGRVDPVIRALLSCAVAFRALMMRPVSSLESGQV
jgi:hypothetical protein